MHKVGTIELYGITFMLFCDECGYWSPRVAAYYDTLAELVSVIESMMGGCVVY